MQRPIGVTLIVLLLVAATVFLAARSTAIPALRGGHKAFAAVALLALLALVATHALWAQRPYALLAFTAWALCAMAGLALSRMAARSGAHHVSLFGPIVEAGLAYVAAALYLRRIV